MDAILANEVAAKERDELMKEQEALKEQQRK